MVSISPYNMYKNVCRYSQPGLFGLRGYSGHNTKRITNGHCPAQIAPRIQSHLTHSFCKMQHPND